MPFLNWREHAVGRRIADHPKREKLLEIEFSASNAASLADALEGVYARAEGELRLEMPEGWAIFWKEREGESRLLLAHPKEHEWIATAALTHDHGLAVVAGLRQLGPGATLSVSQLGAVARMSNVELELRLGS